MEYRPLGRTGLTVSALCFGCWEIGGLFWGRIDAKKAVNLIRHAVDLGVTTFDTADVYGNGRSEVILGFALRHVRDKVVIVTKAGYQVGADGAQSLYVDAQGFVDQRFDPDYLRWQCELSLWRLRCDYVDVFLLHDPSVEIVERDEPFEALHRLKREGKARAVGISSSVAACRRAIERGVVEVVECGFNFLQTEAKEQLFALAVEKGVGVLARSPFAGGRLFAPEHAEKLRALVPHLPLPEAAVKFVLAHPQVSSCVTGIMRLRELRQNARAAEPPYLTLPS
ncbi:General stress protein 69 [bacterium HR17]|jgi:aryl-alcohol dehydrogenase-like predicted oxidoreductase|uniref:General stress protein 69 n=1 Tax=Candidatus Fervidibacter japonicus TaxID=2035412 RepID=A0A2H5XE85_9BACT|nr:General stress protein 69 [bacterium HR17]